MKLSDISWKKAEKIYQAIVMHPFNQELMNGTLPFNKFTYYLEQDQFYTRSEGHLEMLIVKKIDEEYKDDFKKYAEESLAYEQELQYFLATTSNVTVTGKITWATTNYINHFYASVLTPVEVPVAKNLPCFWFYRELGDYMAAYSVPNNPYAKFITSYSGEAFNNSTNNYINIYDELGRNAPAEIQQEMIEGFYQSALHEWHFIDDAYYGRVYDESFYLWHN